MTNIAKKNKDCNMQTHIAKAYEILDKYLPFNYVDLVHAKFPENAKVSKGMIRNVKSKSSKRIDILNAMVEVALENKQLIENFKKITT